MFYPNFARKVFPCFDEPHFKSTFQLIIQHSKQKQAISNMDVRKTVRFIDSNIWFFMSYFSSIPIVMHHYLDH